MSIVRIIHDTFTLYMFLILINWLGPMIGLELKTGRLRWIPRITEPLIDKVRKLLPQMGPLDFGPIALILFLWMMRELTIKVIISSA